MRGEVEDERHGGRDAEWTAVGRRTRLPAGTTGVRLEAEATVDVIDDGVFADGLYVVPEG